MAPATRSSKKKAEAPKKPSTARIPIKKKAEAKKKPSTAHIPTRTFFSSLPKAEFAKPSAPSPKSPKTHERDLKKKADMYLWQLNYFVAKLAEEPEEAFQRAADYVEKAVHALYEFGKGLNAYYKD